jgi:23S rRNA-/tRNA-specific pseudouridylate synthase
MSFFKKIIVLFETNGVLAVCKPAGLPTQAPWGIESVESLIRRQKFQSLFKESIATGGKRHPGGFLGVPHRLDRAVSGIMLLASTPRAARQLSRQFERREIRKTYVAIVKPRMGEAFKVEPFFWQDEIRKVPNEPRVEIVKSSDGNTKLAQTRGRVLASRGGFYALELHPETGRMHQLRVQAARHGMPIVGDSLYDNVSAEDIDTIRNRPIALHARSIEYVDPESNQSLIARAPIPDISLWNGWHHTFSTQEHEWS